MAQENNSSNDPRPLEVGKVAFASFVGTTITSVLKER